jgi:hypothetical protein
MVMQNPSNRAMDFKMVRGMEYSYKKEWQKTE